RGSIRCGRFEANEPLMRQDFLYALRGLRRTPSFTAAARLTLSLGIGANTAMFSIVYGALLRPLPYRASDRLVAAWLDCNDTRNGLAKSFVSWGDVRDWQQARSFEAFAGATWAWPGAGSTFIVHGTARDALVVAATDSFFSVLGAEALVGRTFRPSDTSGG